MDAILESCDINTEGKKRSCFISSYHEELEGPIPMRHSRLLRGPPSCTLSRVSALANAFATLSQPWTWMMAWICYLGGLSNLDVNRMEVPILMC